MAFANTRSAEAEIYYTVVPEIDFSYETLRGEFKNFEEDVFYIKSGECYGTCPVFEMYLFPNGRLVFVGNFM